MHASGRFLAPALVVVVSCTLGLAQTARELQRAAGYTEQATRALNEDDLPRARAGFDKALAIVPALPDAHMGLGHIATKQGKFDEALGHYERARDGFPVLGASLIELQGKRYNETQRQITTLRDNLRTLQASTSTRTDPTVIDRRSAEIEDAIRRLEAVEPPKPGAQGDPPGEVFFYIGNAQFRLDRLDQALVSWETCVAKSPKFAMVRNNLAVAYWKKGRLDDAMRSLERAAELGFPVNPKMKADLEKAAGQKAAPPKPGS